MRLLSTVGALLCWGAILDLAEVVSSSKHGYGFEKKDLDKRAPKFFNVKAPLPFTVTEFDVATKQSHTWDKTSIKNALEGVDSSNGMVIDTAGRGANSLRVRVGDPEISLVEPDPRVGHVYVHSLKTKKTKACTVTLLPGGQYALTARHCGVTDPDRHIIVYVRIGYENGAFRDQANVVAAFEIPLEHTTNPAKIALRDFTILVLDKPLGSIYGHFYVARNVYPAEQGLLLANNVMYPNLPQASNGESPLYIENLQVTKGAYGAGPLVADGVGGPRASGSALYRELDDGTEVVMGAMKGPGGPREVMFSGGFTEEMDELAIVFLFAVMRMGFA